MFTGAKSSQIWSVESITQLLNSSSTNNNNHVQITLIQTNPQQQQPSNNATTDTIALNGVVVNCKIDESNNDRLSVFVTGDNLDKTNLGELQQGSRVNVEFPNSNNPSQGHHIIGSIDNTATLTDITSDSNTGLKFTFKMSALLLPPTSTSTHNNSNQTIGAGAGNKHPIKSSSITIGSAGNHLNNSMVQNGHIAIDGVSFILSSVSPASPPTVAAASASDETVSLHSSSSSVFPFLEFSVILPHPSPSSPETTSLLATRKIGDTVNIETDIIGKYVARNIESIVNAESLPKHLTDSSSLDKLIDRAVTKALEKRGLSGKAANLLGR